MITIAKQIWDMKYRFKKPDGTPIDETIEDTWWRIANALAEKENEPDGRAAEFYSVLNDFKYLPAGRIIAGAGTGRAVTLFNCYVMGTIPDSMDGIFSNLREAALTMQQGGGIGYDFSTLRPKGALVKGVGADASGPLTFMDTWDAMCRTIMSAGARRGAMMATLRCDHPDVEDFIEAKATKDRLTQFNMSVLVTDAFMAAVEADADWPLVFGGVVYKTVRAKELWEKILRGTYEKAEPGVIFIDRINKQNPLYYCETIAATNPCVVGETLIAVAGRGAVPIKQLAEEGNDVPVYACDTATGEQVVRWGRNPRLTQRNVPVLKITLDDGSTLRTTWDHRFPLRDGRKVKARDLKAGDSLFRFDAVIGRSSGETWVDGKLEYHLIAEAKYDRKFEWGTNRGQYHAHHIDGDHLNNSWDNVEVMLAEHHSTEHRTGDANPMRRWWSNATDEERKRYRENMRASTSGERNGMWGKSHSAETKIKIGAKTTERYTDDTYAEKHRTAVKLSMGPEQSAKIRKSREAMFMTLHKVCEYCHSPFIVRAASYTSGSTRKRFCTRRCAVTFRNKQPKVAHNHKIVSVEPDGFSDVYNITVDEFHNYAAVTSFNLSKYWDNPTLSGVYQCNCGEQPLPPYGACLLGSINLTQFVCEPFTNASHLDLNGLIDTVKTAVRMMDNVIDVSLFPLKEQEREAKAKRRIGLGMTGLADALIMLGVRYGSENAVKLAEDWAMTIEYAAYQASIELAKEKGPFPFFDRDKYLEGEYVRNLPEDIRAGIATHGLRNSHLTSVAPTGTISLLAGNVSSGIEPVFSWSYTRKVLQKDGSRTEEMVEDYAYRVYRELGGDVNSLPDYFVATNDLTPEEHVYMQAAVQNHVDSSISKTINVPEDISFAAFGDVYKMAYELGCKGCTTYRPNDITGSVLSVTPTAPAPAPTQRPPELEGKTYKLKWPDSDHAFYVTINDVVENGMRRPYEMFFNTKATDHYAWMSGLSRMVSAVFRHGGDVSFVGEELKAVFDPRGGAWLGGRYVPSMLAAVGDIVNGHLAWLGGGTATATPVASKGSQCPKCLEFTLVRQEGCQACSSCGYSKCG